MTRWQIEDFTNPTKEVLFELCMEDYGALVLFEKLHKEIDRESFRDILVRYDLQSTTDLIIDYQIGWNHVQSGLESGRKKQENRKHNSRPYALKVAKILKMFFSSEEREYKSMEITARYKADKVDIASKDLFDQLKVGFIKEFERLGLHETELSVEEAKEELEDIGDGVYFEEYGYESDEILSDPLILEMYRLDHVKPREVTLEIVNKAISEIEIIQERSKRGAGAKIKNLGLGELAKRLSYLHRMKNYLNYEEHSSINNYPLSNETCRFIYDYFEFWNLLSDSVKYNKEDKDLRSSYIKSLIRNNKSYFSKNYSYFTTRNYILFYDENLEIKIDLFKKVKDGLLTLSEYNEKMSLI